MYSRFVLLFLNPCIRIGYTIAEQCNTLQQNKKKTRKNAEA